MHGGMVKVDTIHKCVLFDEDTEKALASTHFGESYLCRVDPKNPIVFFPLDRKYPKFINLPVLSVRAKNGVICFDPKSINSSAKVNNFIPLEVATKMLFMVKFLGWQKKYSYPLGIIVAALPSGHSPYTGELLLRISNSIPLTSCPVEETQASTVEGAYTLAFVGAFTIDPEGSSDHDDALTCKIVSKTDNCSVYEVGVHITNVERYIPKDSQLDKKACQRGCAAYRSPDHCISCMLPEEMIHNSLSISHGSTRYALSVLIQYSVDNRGTVEEAPDSIIFAESKVQSNLALTYEEAQKVLFKLQNSSSDPLYGKVAQYNHQSLSSDHLRIEDQLSVLWKIAMYIRRKRIGEDAAYSFIIEDSDDQRCPEAHILIQELMIWTNKSVAIKLLNSFPNATVLRVQNKPSEDDLIRQHGAGMAISLALRSRAGADETPVDQAHILTSVYAKIKKNLENGQILNVHHHIQFEHLHPQIAVAVAGLHQSRRSCGADYVVSTEDKKEYWHDTLQCAQYTHFTSPIRRYIDIVVQRLLRAAIHTEKCPYNRVELQEICRQTKEAVKRSNNYAREVRRLDLATQLRKIGQQVVSIVQQITKDAEVELIFIDPLLSVLYPRERSIALKHLNAQTLPIKEIEQSESVQNSNSTQCSDSRKFESLANDSVIWQAKMSSFQGTAMSFFSNPMLQLIKNVTDSDYDHNRYAEISLLSLENGIISERSNLIENKMIAKVFPLTEAVSASTWAQLQEIIKYDRSDQELRKIVSKMFSVNDNLSYVTSFPTLMSSPSPMWIYKLHRPINMSEVLHVQLTASRLEYVLSPTLQLVEVGPELRICIQHNHNVSVCFADKLVNDASKRTYNSMEEYFKCWEQVLLYEAVVESLTESELLLIRDVSLEWPELNYECDSLGQASYKLVIPAGEPKAGVVMEIPKEFMTISHDFFTFRVGDLLCIRYDIERNQEKLGFVLHMVIHHIDPDPRTRTTKQNDRPEKVNLYLKFVGNNSNFISPQIAELLTLSDTKTCLKCEIQLLPLTLPFR
jgi:exoribonuclease R